MSEQTTGEGDRRRLTLLEQKVYSMEGTLLKVPLVIAVVCLLLGLMTPTLTDASDSVYLFSTALEALGEPANTTGGFSGENVVYGIGVLGTIASLLVTVLVLLLATSRCVDRGWAVAGRVATVLMTVGIAVVALLVVVSGDDTSAGVGILLLSSGAVAALIVMFGLKHLWKGDY